MTADRFNTQLDKTLTQARRALTLANEITLALLTASERPWRPIAR